MNRVYLTLCAVLLALILPLGYLVYSGGQEIAELKQQNKVLTEAAERAQARLISDRKVLVARQAKIAAQARLLQKQKTELDRALRNNQSWADTPVPASVQEALQNGN